MFGIGFSELIIIGIVALIAIGPENLPAMAAKVGRFVWDIRRAWDDVRDTVRDEVMTVRQPFDDIRRSGAEARDLFKKEAENIRKTTRDSVDEAEKAVQDGVKTEKPEADAAPAESKAELNAEAAQVAPVSESGPQPYKRPAPALRSVAYYDLDGNLVEAPAKSDAA